MCAVIDTGDAELEALRREQPTIRPRLNRAAQRYEAGEIDDEQQLAGVGVNEMHCHRSSDVESTRRAVRKIEAAGLVETRMIYRNDRGMRQIGVRLAV